jgi:hypothetical protein
MADDFSIVGNGFGFMPSPAPPAPPSVNIYNSDGTISDAIRTVDIDNNQLVFSNGQVTFGTALSSNYAVEVNNSSFAGGLLASAAGVALKAVSSTGVGTQTEGVTGIQAYSSSGNAVFGSAQGGGIGGFFQGGTYVETYGLGGSMDSNAVFDVNSTTKYSKPFPQMTTAQKLLIPLPSVSATVFDLTANRFEMWNGTYWEGTRQPIYIGHAAWGTPTDLATAVFGSVPISPQTAGGTFSAFDIELRGNGVIRACTFNSWASGVAGSNEAWSLYIRVNATDYLVQTLSTVNPIRQFKNTSLNIPYVNGDILRMVYVNPNWITANPTQVLGSGIITLQ